MPICISRKPCGKLRIRPCRPRPWLLWEKDRLKPRDNHKECKTMADLRKTTQMVDMAEKWGKNMAEGRVISEKRPKGSSYPYGLRLTLNKDQLRKMKISPRDMTIGDKVEIEAMAKVVRISESYGPDDEDKSIELQITKLAVFEG
jgi:hypothetical protein